MSSRALKKKQEALKSKVEDENLEDISGEESEDEPIATTKSTFSMLNFDEDEQDEDEEQEEIIEKPKTNNTNKKAKSNNSNKKNNNSNNNKQKPNNSNSKPKNKKNKDKKSEDILDQFINNGGSDLKPNSESNNKLQLDPKYQEFYQLFKVNPSNLAPDNELKRLLGCSVSDFKSSDQPKKKGNVHSNHNLGNIKKNFMFITPKPDWPYVYKSMIMEIDKPSDNKTTTTTTTTTDNNNNNNNNSLYKDGITYYKIRWTQSYRELQDAFYRVLESHNPMTIVELLKINQYHIDSLLQLSQVCLQSADYQNAGEFVERAVFSFEISWHHSFNPLSMSNSRFEYRHDENKSCFLAMFRWIQILGKRGCPATALEFCKVLLSFDLKDPLYLRLVIDYYALRSKQYKFLLDLYEKQQFITPESSQPLKFLPNFCYSAALASFLLEEENNTPQKSRKSNQLLQQALISFPSMVKPLVEKLKTSLLVVNNGVPKDLCNDPFFSNTDNKEISHHLITLFVERNHQLWQQSPSILEWLKDNASIVIGKAKNSPAEINQIQEPIRKEYSTMDSNIFDHLVLSEYSDVIQNLPPDVLEMMRREGYANMAPERIDPQQQQQQPQRRGLGNGVQIYQQQQLQQNQRRQLEHLQRQLQNQEINQQQHEQLLQQINNHNQPILHNAVPHHSNPIIDFLQTLLPWNDPTQINNQNQQRQQGFLDDYIDYEDEEDDEDN